MKRTILISLILLISTLTYADVWVEQPNMTPEEKEQIEKLEKAQKEIQEGFQNLKKDLKKEIHKTLHPEEKTELEKRADAVSEAVISKYGGKKANSFLDKLVNNPHFLLHLVLIFILICIPCFFIGRKGRRKIMLIRQGYLQPKEQRQLERKRRRDKPKIKED